MTFPLFTREMYKLNPIKENPSNFAYKMDTTFTSLFTLPMATRKRKLEEGKEKSKRVKVESIKVPLNPSLGDFKTAPQIKFTLKNGTLKETKEFYQHYGHEGTVWPTSIQLRNTPENMRVVARLNSLLLSCTAKIFSEDGATVFLIGQTPEEDMKRKDQQEARRGVNMALEALDKRIKASSWEEIEVELAKIGGLDAFNIYVQNSKKQMLREWIAMGMFPYMK